MGLIRVYVLAMELGLPNEDVVTRLAEAGLAVRSHSSNVDETKAREILAGLSLTPKPPPRYKPVPSARPVLIAPTEDMGLIRIYELAKDLNLPNKDVVVRLSAAGLDVRSHSSPVNEARARKILAGVPGKPKPMPRPRPVNPAQATVTVTPKPSPAPPPTPHREAVTPAPSPRANAEDAIPTSPAETTKPEDYVAQGLELLRRGLAPYVLREVKQHYGARWLEDGLEEILKDTASSKLNRKAKSSHEEPLAGLDAHALLKILRSHWRLLFESTLGRLGRTYINELSEVRNQWAHQEPFTVEDGYRALDTMTRLLRIVSADQANRTARIAKDLLRVIARQHTTKTPGLS